MRAATLHSVNYCYLCLDNIHGQVNARGNKGVAIGPFAGKVPTYRKRTMPSSPPERLRKNKGQQKSFSSFVEKALTELYTLACRVRVPSTRKEETLGQDAKHQPFALWGHLGSRRANAAPDSVFFFSFLICCSLASSRLPLPGASAQVRKAGRTKGLSNNTHLVVAAAGSGSRRYGSSAGPELT